MTRRRKGPLSGSLRPPQKIAEIPPCASGIVASGFSNGPRQRGRGMNLEVLVPIADLLAFFMITPEILGPERLEGIVKWLDRVYLVIYNIVGGMLGFNVPRVAREDTV